MSLVDSTPPSARSLQAVGILLAGPVGMFQNIFAQWQMQFRLIWDSENPQEVLDGLGVHAAELFQLSAAMVQFLETIKPGCTTEVLSKMKPCTINQDGTVTIQAEPAPEE